MTRRPTASNRKKLQFEELEPRLLYSADWAGVFAQDHGVDGNEPEQLIDLDIEYAPAIYLNRDQQGQEERRELVFVDPRTPDYQQLLDDMAANGDNGRTLEVIVLDADRDGIEQISEVLAGRSGVDAVHIISHGDEGEVQLGDSWLSSDNLQSYNAAIAGWARALDQDADLLFYGCNLAGSDDGLSLLDALGQLTGADVAASDDLTGSSALGGDWDFEYLDGNLESALALSAELQQDFQGVLAAPVADAGGPYTIYEGQDVNLDASASNDPDGDPKTYQWDIDNDGDYDENIIGETPTVTWADLQSLFMDDDGVYPITVEVTANGETDTDTVNLTIIGPGVDQLWISTDDDVASPSGVSGVDSWSAGTALMFDDTLLDLEPGITTGTAGKAFNLDDLAVDGNAVLADMHYVTTATTVGGGVNTFDLLPGDLLITTDNDEDWNNSDFSTTAADKEDVVVFRPDVAGDYSAGEFTILLDNPTGK
ncbi:MAG: DUF4347 domain-containing protein, partial [Gammaproteobacteria bacterium]|nr:DUF4347 domain-containing protein [Gammaproteobacteria bacterium]